MHLNTGCAQTDGQKDGRTESKHHSIFPIHYVHLADIISDGLWVRITFMGQYGRPNLALAGLLIYIITPYTYHRASEHLYRFFVTFVVLIVLLATFSS